MELEVVLMTQTGEEVTRIVDVPLKPELLEKYEQSVIEAHVFKVLGWSTCKIRDVRLTEDENDKLSRTASTVEHNSRLVHSRDSANRAFHARTTR